VASFTRLSARDQDPSLADLRLKPLDPSHRLVLWLCPRLANRCSRSRYMTTMTRPRFQAVRLASITHAQRSRWLFEFGWAGLGMIVDIFNVSLISLSIITIHLFHSFLKKYPPIVQLFLLYLSFHCFQVISHGPTINCLLYNHNSWLFRNVNCRFDIKPNLCWVVLPLN